VFIVEWNKKKCACGKVGLEEKAYSEAVALSSITTQRMGGVRLSAFKTSYNKFKKSIRRIKLSN
jgi:hypothetical protein